MHSWGLESQWGLVVCGILEPWDLTMCFSPQSSYTPHGCIPPEQRKQRSNADSPAVSLCPLHPFPRCLCEETLISLGPVHLLLAHLPGISGDQESLWLTADSRRFISQWAQCRHLLSSRRDEALETTGLLVCPRRSNTQVEKMVVHTNSRLQAQRGSLSSFSL